MSISREHILHVWDQNWAGGWGYVPWSQALEGISAEHAAWTPQEGRLSIWEIALHLNFWREVMVRRARGEQVSGEERDRRNHGPLPQAATEEAWHDVRRQFTALQQQVHDAILDAEEYEDFLHLRAMQGLRPVV